MTLVANALTTVARVKDASAVPCSDSRLEFLIAEVTDDFLKHTGRPSFGFVTVTTDSPDYYKGSGTGELWLLRRPILTITRVREWGATLTANTDFFRTSRYDDLGCLLRGTAPGTEYAWSGSAGLWPDLTRDACSREDARSWNIDVCGTFGYILPQYSGVLNATHNPSTSVTTLPPGLEGACIREVLRRAFRPNVPGLKVDQSSAGARLEWFEDKSGNGNPFDFHSQTLDALSSYCLPGRWFA